MIRIADRKQNGTPAKSTKIPSIEIVHLEDCIVLAVIGGTDLYNLPGLVIDQRIGGDTPLV
jgi:hypothetical protein